MSAAPFSPTKGHQGPGSVRLVKFAEETKRAAELAGADEEEDEQRVFGSVWPAYGQLGKMETPERLKAACDRVFDRYARDCDEFARRGPRPKKLDLSAEQTLTPEDSAGPVPSPTTGPSLACSTTSADGGSGAPTTGPTVVQDQRASASPPVASPASDTPTSSGERVSRRAERPQERAPMAGRSRILTQLRHAKERGLPIKVIAARAQVTVPEARVALLDLLEEGAVRMGDGAQWIATTEAFA